VPPVPPVPGGKPLRHLRPPKDANSSAQPIVQ
jgi:hypothetical protein